MGNPSERTRRVINNLLVELRSHHYTVSDGGGRILHKGNCEKQDTPRMIYDRHYPPPEKDGRVACDVTLFYADLHSQYGVMRYAKCAVLQPCRFDELYEYRSLIPNYREDREGYRLFYQPVSDPRPQVWTARPRIIAARGQVYEVPHNILFAAADPHDPNRATPRLYLTYQQEQDAVVRYLDDAGIAWREL